MTEKQEFFDQLYEDNREILLRTARIYLRTEEDAEDMVQDTFSRARAQRAPVPRPAERHDGQRDGDPPYAL